MAIYITICYLIRSCVYISLDSIYNYAHGESSTTLASRLTPSLTSFRFPLRLSSSSTATTTTRRLHQ